jgi:hypothetical protein
MARVGTLAVFMDNQRRARSSGNSRSVGMGKHGMIMYRNA